MVSGPWLKKGDADSVSIGVIGVGISSTFCSPLSGDYVLNSLKATYFVSEDFWERGGLDAMFEKTYFFMVGFLDLNFVD